jgi:hypothetical protein
MASRKPTPLIDASLARMALALEAIADSLAAIDYRQRRSETEARKHDRDRHT